MSVTVNNLTKIYGSQKAVNQLSFNLKAGEVTGFLGPNGAGKSTTMKMLTCYLLPTSGYAEVCGHNILTDPLEVRKKIGYLPESNPLYFDMYVKEYLAFVAKIHKVKQSSKRIKELIELTGLTKEQNKKIIALSKGYKQRVGLAQSLMHEPEVLILDEPTSGLDPNQIVDIRELIIELGKGKTILLSTHIMQEVQAMCNRVLIINNGVLVADESINNINQKVSSQEILLFVRVKKPIDVDKALQLTTVIDIKTKSENSYIFTLKSDEEGREELSGFFAEHGNIIYEMQTQTTGLEDVFRTLTQKNTK